MKLGLDVYSGYNVQEAFQQGGTETEQDRTYRISDMAESERPRERLAKHGTQVLTNAELLAILLRVGVQGENAVELGRRLLNEFGGI